MWLSDKIAGLKRKVASPCWRLGIRIKNLLSILQSGKRRRILLDILNGKGVDVGSMSYLGLLRLS